MATLREVRSRISGVKKTQKITRAMKMVAAAKLRRAQSSVVGARPYAEKMKQLLQLLSGQVHEEASPLLATREVKKVVLVVVTADRGLCGAFNSNLIKAAVQHLENAYPGWKDQDRAKLICVGKKGSDFFGKRKFAVTGRYLGVYNHLVFGQAQSIAKDLVQGYLGGDYDRVEVIYNEFKNIAQSRIVVDQFLPVPSAGQVEWKGAPVAVDYIYEPSKELILEAIVPRHLNFQIWRILLESNAAEQGARMAAMENATKNANDMIRQLQLQYNKARQASITKELLEVVGGAEALSQA
jgi:F-type H+-transporting ATPase subunit gamma